MFRLQSSLDCHPAHCRRRGRPRSSCGHLLRVLIAYHLCTECVFQEQVLVISDICPCNLHDAGHIGCRQPARAPSVALPPKPTPLPTASTTPMSPLRRLLCCVDAIPSHDRPIIVETETQQNHRLWLVTLCLHYSSGTDHKFLSRHCAQTGTSSDE